MSPPDAIAATALLASVGSALSSLEFLTLGPQFGPRGAFSSTLFAARTRASAVPGFVRRAIASPGGVRGLILLRLVAAGAVASAIAATTARPGILALALAGALAAGSLLSYRCGAGGEGGSFATAGLWFIAAQSCLSYAVAGIAKLASPSWRSGEALVKVMKTASFGSTRIWRLTSARPRLARAGCWAVILFECLFPVALVLPAPLMYAVLGAGAAFHVALAFTMGLNCFLWAFVAAYPAIAYCNGRVGVLLGG